MPLNSEQTLTLLDRMAKLSMSISIMVAIQRRSLCPLLQDLPCHASSSTFTGSAGAWNAIASVVSDVDPSFTGVGIFEWQVEMAARPVGTGA